MQRQNEDGTWDMNRENCALLGILFDSSLTDDKYGSHHRMTEMALKEIKRVGKDILEKGKKHHARRSSYQWSKNIMEAEKVMKKADMKRRRERSLSRASWRKSSQTGSEYSANNSTIESFDSVDIRHDNNDYEEEDDEEEIELSKIMDQLTTTGHTNKIKIIPIVDDRGEYVRLSPTEDGSLQSTNNFNNSAVVQDSIVTTDGRNLNNSLLVRSLRSASSSSALSAVNFNLIRQQQIKPPAPPLLPTKSFYEVKLSKKFTNSEFIGAKLLASQRLKAKRARKNRLHNFGNTNNNFNHNVNLSPPLSTFQIEPSDLLAAIKHIARKTNAINSPKKSFYTAEETLDLHLGPRKSPSPTTLSEGKHGKNCLNIISSPPQLDKKNIDKNVETMLKLKENPKYFWAPFLRQAPQVS